MNSYSMQVIKRNGHSETVSFDKVLQRIRKASRGLCVNPDILSQQVLARIIDGIKTSELDELAAQMAASLCTTHPDWGTLASRIVVSNHQKNTEADFSKVVATLSNQVMPKTGEPLSYLSDGLVAVTAANAAAIDAYIKHDRDYEFDYFGFKTLEKSYLLKDTSGVVMERPQHMWMRVALALWSNDLEKAFETYDLLSKKFLTHATPTLFNAGTPRPQLSSCYLLAMADDSIAGIYKTLGDCAAISKYAGGIGLHVHNIRARGALIKGTNGSSNGLVPMLRVFNNTARYVDQCFEATTEILTSKGVIHISNINPGDYVLTSGCKESVEESGKHYVQSSGPSWCRVSMLVSHKYVGPVLEIQTNFGAVTVTPSHPVLAVTPIGLDYVEIGKLSIGTLIRGYDENLNPVDHRIESIATKDFQGTLYDLEVDGTHDYVVAHLGVAHNGGGRRNGSFAIYLEPWHADIEDFLKLKLNTGAEEERARDLFYALWLSDLFMRRVEADESWSLFCPSEAPGLADVWGAAFEQLYLGYEAKGVARKVVSARKLWFQILDTQMETGTPYLVYKDAANGKSNQQNLGTIKSSNLCVAPETLILTDKGQFPIRDLVNATVRVWNGEVFSETTVVQTGVDQELLDVELSDGRTLTCTPYHKFIVTENYDDKRSIADSLRVDASDLKTGMKLRKGTLPTIVAGSVPDFVTPYTHGFFCGDGTYSNGRPTLSLYGEKKNLVAHLAIRTMSGVEDSSTRLNTTLHPNLEAKFNVPLNTSLQCRLEWLAGYLDADGTVANNGDNQSIQVSSINYDFLKNIQSLLITMGVQSKVNLLFGERKVMLPDGHGGTAPFDCQPLWRLLISSSGLYHLSTLGFTTHRLSWVARKPQRNAEHFITVVQVVRRDRRDDTYCFNEPINHAGTFNGILTGNCTEILEYSSPDETAVCNLASLALPAFVSKGAFDFDALRDAVRIATRNLNRVIDINFYPTPETERSNMRHRPIGLGVQGLADVFAMLRLAWESPAAADLNQRIFEHLYFAAVSESATLALTEGPYSSFQGSPASKGQLQPDLWISASGPVKPLTEADGTLDWAGLRVSAATGLRNSLLVAPMPTASTSQILGYNECFEPFTSNIYTRRTLAGEFIVINRHLMQELLGMGLWNDDMKQAIVARNGSVQGLATIPEEVQARYKTAWEIPQKTLIDMAAARGAFICQSQSLNLFMADPNYAKLTSMHFYGWKKGLKTGCYYLRTKAPVAAQKFTIDPRLSMALQGAVPDTMGEDSDEDSPKPETRDELKARLAREYEEEAAKECTNCSA